MSGKAKSPEHREKLAAANRGKKHSEETKAKMRASHALLPPKSDETKAKMSAAAMGKPKSAAARLAMSLAKKGKPGRKRSAQEIENLRLWTLGSKWSAATRAKNSGANSPHFGKPPRHKPRVTYGASLMRSSWEVAFATSLDRRGVRWQYEPCRFNLGSCTYTPDFWLPDEGVYWEVKGYMDRRSVEKIRLFRELNPDVPLIVGTKPVLKLMGAL